MPLDRRVGNYFDNSGSFIRRVARWTGPTSYPAGGEVVTPSTFGMGTIVAALFNPAIDPAGAGSRFVVWNPATAKLMWFTITAGAVTEVANATDLSAYSCQFEIIGN
jgi:hypothetical protein